MPGPVVAGGWERPGSEKYRFLFKILFKSIDFESRGRWEQAAGSGRDWKGIVFLFKILFKSINFEAGAGWRPLCPLLPNSLPLSRSALSLSLSLSSLFLVAVAI